MNTFQGCSETNPCMNVTVRGFDTRGPVGLAVGATDPDYTNLWFDQIQSDGSIQVRYSTNSSLFPTALITNSTFIETFSDAQLRLFAEFACADPTSLIAYGAVTIANNYFRTANMKSDNGVIGSGCVGGVQPGLGSFARIVSNVWIVDDVDHPAAGDDECSFFVVGVSGFPGRTVFENNTVYIRASTGCPTDGVHTWWGDNSDHGSRGPGFSEIYIRNNSVTYEFQASGFANDRLDFIAPSGRQFAGGGVLTDNHTFYVEGNDFNVFNTGTGDFNIQTNVRDFFMRDEVGLNTSVVYRNQEVKYGVEYETGTEGTVHAWDMIPHADEALTSRGELRVPATGDGLFYFDSVERKIAITGSDVKGSQAGSCSFTSSTTCAVNPLPVTENDANYLVTIGCDTNLTFWLTGKTTTAFTINSSAMTSATCDWMLTR